MIIALDASPLSCFARAGRLDLLEALTEGYERVTVKAVLHEIEDGFVAHPALRKVSTLP